MSQYDPGDTMDSTSGSSSNTDWALVDEHGMLQDDDTESTSSSVEVMDGEEDEEADPVTPLAGNSPPGNILQPLFVLRLSNHEVSDTDEEPSLGTSESATDSNTPDVVLLMTSDMPGSLSTQKSQETADNTQDTQPSSSPPPVSGSTGQPVSEEDIERLRQAIDDVQSNLRQSHSASSSLSSFEMFGEGKHDSGCSLTSSGSEKTEIPSQTALPSKGDNNTPDSSLSDARATSLEEDADTVEEVGLDDGSLETMSERSLSLVCDPSSRAHQREQPDFRPLLQRFTRCRAHDYCLRWWHCLQNEHWTLSCYLFFILLVVGVAVFNIYFAAFELKVSDYDGFHQSFQRRPQPVNMELEMKKLEEQLMMTIHDNLHLSRSYAKMNKLLMSTIHVRDFFQAETKDLQNQIHTMHKELLTCRGQREDINVDQGATASEQPGEMDEELTQDWSEGSESSRRAEPNLREQEGQNMQTKMNVKQLEKKQKREQISMGPERKEKHKTKGEKVEKDRVKEEKNAKDEMGQEKRETIRMSPERKEKHKINREMEEKNRDQEEKKEKDEVRQEKKEKVKKRPEKTQKDDMRQKEGHEENRRHERNQKDTNRQKRKEKSEGNEERMKSSGKEEAEFEDSGFGSTSSNWMDNIFDIMNKTKGQIEETWHQVRNISDHLWKKHSPTFEKMQNKFEKRFQQLSDKFQQKIMQKTKKWFGKWMKKSKDDNNKTENHNKEEKAWAKADTKRRPFKDEEPKADNQEEDEYMSVDDRCSPQLLDLSTKIKRLSVSKYYSKTAKRLSNLQNEMKSSIAVLLQDEHTQDSNIQTEWLKCQAIWWQDTEDSVVSKACLRYLACWQVRLAEGDIKSCRRIKQEEGNVLDNKCAVGPGPEEYLHYSDSDLDSNTDSGHGETIDKLSSSCGDDRSNACQNKLHSDDADIDSGYDDDVDDDEDDVWYLGRAEDRQYHRDEPDDWFFRRAKDRANSQSDGDENEKKDQYGHDESYYQDL